MLPAKTAPSLLALMGSIDWLTTIVGIGYFGAVESNPFIAELANTNLLAFTVVKLGTALCVAFLFYRAERNLRKAPQDKNQDFKGRFRLLHCAQAISIAVLLAVVLNNVLIVVAALH